ncbi:hypothetical protein TAMA11512_21060 [Selenomonas sp. TAMA-11512]|uniref:electron transfer flavoprotein subunit alpha/FixB family protein n=1 Tax=Selenomonas sp. TAMA-11512 TaxID=3095337 RepID=UPI003089B148|nr:hypothetical protein TAMA11512_21060 [Selenomonas sp. TAMA-11512]
MSEILIFAPMTGSGPSPVFRELITAAREVKSLSGERIHVLAADDGVLSHKEEFSVAGIDEVTLIHTPGITASHTDGLSQAIFAAIRGRDISLLLSPSDHRTRSMLSRLSVKLDTGMTAACSRLIAEKTADGVRVHQLKTSFGSQAWVTCDITSKPNVITILDDSYEPVTEKGSPKITVVEMPDITSAIEVGELTKDHTANRLRGADFVVCVGRGTLENGSLELARRYAEARGAALAGSRPMADQGLIPFTSQIGESGTVIRPEACLIFGVSGAIQFTEGIKGDPVVIAVNQDAEAPIFRSADYKVVGDAKEILDALMKR